jgi:hypothetical protein
LLGRFKDALGFSFAFSLVPGGFFDIHDAGFAKQGSRAAFEGFKPRFESGYAARLRPSTAKLLADYLRCFFSWNTVGKLYGSSIW